jgi:hypothetical protein
MKLIMVNAWCSRYLSFMTLTMGDDLYRVVVSELKLHPTKTKLGSLNQLWCQNAPMNLSTMFNGLTDGCGLGGTPNS